MPETWIHDLDTHESSAQYAFNHCEPILWSFIDFEVLTCGRVHPFHVSTALDYHMDE